MPSHRARGFGRYVAFRATAPRHAAPQPGRPVGDSGDVGRRRTTPVFVLAGILGLGGLLGLVGAGLIALVLEETVSGPREYVTPPEASLPPRTLTLPSPHRPEWSDPHAVRQTAKRRPPPVFATPAETSIGTPCGFLSDDQGWGLLGDTGDPRSWRCYHNRT